MGRTDSPRRLTQALLLLPWPPLRFATARAPLVAAPGLDIETMMRIRRVSDPQLSPDGKTVVSVRKGVDKLTEKDLENIPVPKPYGRIADPAKLREAMIAAIEGHWPAVAGVPPITLAWAPSAAEAWTGRKASAAGFRPR